MNHAWLSSLYSFSRSKISKVKSLFAPPVLRDDHAQHVQRNRTGFLIWGSATASILLAVKMVQQLSQNESYNLTHVLLFDSAIVFFAGFSALSFFYAYSRNAALFPVQVVSRDKKFARAAFALAIGSSLLLILSAPKWVGTATLLFAYFSALIFSVGFRDKLQDFFDDNGPDLPNTKDCLRLADSWVSVNLLLTIILLIIGCVNLLIPDRTAELLKNDHWQLVRFLIYQWLHVVSFVMIVAIRASEGLNIADRNKFVHATSVFCDSAGPPDAEEPPDAPVVDVIAMAAVQDSEIDPNNTTLRCVALKLKALAQSARLISAAVVAGLTMFSGGNALDCCLLLMFLTSAFLFNDWCDIEKDKAGAPERPLPSGMVSPKLVLHSFWIIFAFLHFMAYFSGALATWAALNALSMAYSFALKRTLPEFATFVWCVAATVAVAVTMEMTLANSLYMLLVLYARELVLDLRDTKADLQFLSRKTPSAGMGYHTFMATSTIYILACVVAVSTGGTLAALLAAFASLASFLFYCFVALAWVPQNKAVSVLQNGLRLSLLGPLVFCQI